MKKLVVVLCLLVPSFVAADQPSIPRAGETIEVSIVNLDVIVTDKRGHRVHGLTKDDFEVFEDGTPQTISNFAAYSPEPSSTVTASKSGVVTPEAAGVKRQRRTIAIFIESFRLAPFQVNPMFAQLKKTLHEIVAPGDAVLIATWDMRTVVRLDYTDDLAKIDKTLDDIVKENSGTHFDTRTQILHDLEQVKEFLDGASSAAAASGLPVDGSISDWIADAEAKNVADMELVHLREKANAINSFLSTMANEEGRKVMILMTRRFSDVAGGEAFYAIGQTGLRSMADQSRYKTYELRNNIKATANAHNVTVYALYPIGLESTNVSDPRLRSMPQDHARRYDYDVLNNELAALKDITDSTGGTTTFGSVNIVDMLPRISDDFEDYYSLAYRVSSRNDNRARRVVVKTKNPSYVVRTRKEYMEKNDDGRVRDQVIAALFRDPALSGIGVTAKLGKAESKDKHRFAIPVSVRIPVTSLMTRQEGATTKGAFSVYIATGRVIGETSDITKQTIPFTVADVDKAKDGYFTYDFSLLTDFATNRLAIGVYDEVSHDTGFARVNLY